MQESDLRIPCSKSSLVNGYCSQNVEDEKDDGGLDQPIGKEVGSPKIAQKEVKKMQAELIDIEEEGNFVASSYSPRKRQLRKKLHGKKNRGQTNLSQKIKQISESGKSESVALSVNRDKKYPSTRKKASGPTLRAKTIYKTPYSDSEDILPFKFPLTNPYFSQNTQELMDTVNPIDQKRRQSSSSSFLNCDVRYFNWDIFIEEVGKFDVLIIDPPWRIKGAQKNDSQFMFSNCKFSLEYNTMSNNEIKQLPLHLISDEGFIFLWILNTQLNSSLEIMQSWGYELVEELVWVKLRNEKIYLTHGYYFMHSYEICLVGYKNKRKDGGSMMIRDGLNPNVIFGEVRKKSQKPQDLYTLIEMIFKGKKKIEIFARNHNLRFGIFSVGNELGEAYDKWMLHLNCDKCEHAIRPGNKRFKSKIKANYDICQNCIDELNKEEFFQFANEVDEDVRHEYLSCNNCHIEPIWGIRFQCVTCQDYDLCESCFDLYLSKQNQEEQHHLHPCGHEFRTLQVPVFGYGFEIHNSKCSSCYQNPIIGVCMSCTSCKNFKLCQKCFFERPRSQLVNFSKSHRPDHEFEAIFQEQYLRDKKFQCFNCKKVITEDCWMCENCYNFYFCGSCYANKEKFKSLYANSHKKYHVYSKIF